MKFPTLRRRSRQMMAGVAVAGILVGGLMRSRAGEQKPAVVLDLVKATAERSDRGVVLFCCTATLKNNFGAELRVRTNFSSVFDGIEVVVLGESGEKLRQQPYVYHQSPYSFRGRDLPLKTGETRETLTFPVDLPKGTRSVRLLLVGILPGCDRSGLLCSGSATVAIPPEPE